MTYPPQGPYGQQPDPYGQQQPDPYGQYGGGYQQPAGQYGGGYDPNAQYGGGAQYGGLGGPPPKKNTGPIIAVIAIVVLLLGGLGITGFVAPGFFLADDKKEAGDGSGDNTSKKNPEGGGSEAEAFAKKLVAAADEQDKSALRDLKCENADDIVDAAIDAIDDTSSAELKDTKKESADEYVVLIDITHEDGTDEYEATIKKDGGDWCWQGFIGDDVPTGTDTPTDEPTDDTETSTPPTGGGGGGGGGGGSDGEEFVQSFLDKLNAGDGAGANSLLCPDSTSQSDVTEAAGKSPSLEMDPAGTQADSTYVGADLKGSMGGEEITSARTSAFLEDAGWCIYTFYAF
jgi:hypothetical protein